MIEFDETHLLMIEEQRNSGSGLARHQRYLELLSPAPGERVLDVGCGSGAFCRLLAPLVQPGGEIVGMDTSANAVALATRLAVGYPSSLLRFECADGVEQPFADGSFDASTCISVLAFCEQPEQVLSEIRRVLRPGGRLLVANTDEDLRVYNGHDRQLGRRITHAIADRSLHPWIGRQLGQLLRRSGFTVTRESISTNVEQHFQPGMAGFIFAHSWRDYLTEQAGIAADDYERWIRDLEQCEQQGSYSYSATNFAYLVER